MLQPLTEFEVKLVLFSFILVSDIQRMSKFKLFDVRSVHNSSQWKGRDEIFKCKNERLLSKSDLRGGSSFTWQYLLVSVSFYELSMIPLILSIGSVIWSGCIMASALNFIFLPFFNSKYSSFEIVEKGIISAKHFRQYQS